MGKKIIIRSSGIYTRLDVCKIFGWEHKQSSKRRFEYLRYTVGANFVLGPAPRNIPRHKKYYISGSDFYLWIRKRKPNFIKLLSFIDE